MSILSSCFLFFHFFSNILAPQIVAFLVVVVGDVEIFDIVVDVDIGDGYVVGVLVFIVVVGLGILGFCGSPFFTGEISCHFRAVAVYRLAEDSILGVHCSPAAFMRSLHQ